jgi:hypothetical protein
LKCDIRKYLGNNDHEIVESHVTPDWDRPCGLPLDNFTRPPTPSAECRCHRVALARATKDAPFENTQAMTFVPVAGTDVLFCIHEVRWRDYVEYAK